MTHPASQDRIAHRRLVKRLALVALLAAALLVWVILFFEPDRRLARRPGTDPQASPSAPTGDSTHDTAAQVDPAPGAASQGPDTATATSGPVEAEPPPEPSDPVGSQLAFRPTSREPPPDMVYVSAGEVAIGIDTERARALAQEDTYNLTLFAAETPRRFVDLDAFFIDRTEVTNLQWKVYLEAASREPSDVLTEYSWPGGRIPQGMESFPVTNVSLTEVQDYLRWCGKRLPSEAEWVRAARGDNAEFDYPYGRHWDLRKCQSGLTIPQRPVSVGRFPFGASPFGALDMAGNVFEWTSSRFAPFEGFEPLDFKRGRGEYKLAPNFDDEHFVIKGGCFVSDATLSRIDVRVGKPPRDSDEALGFRAARSVRPGVDVLRHAYRRLLPPGLARARIDERDAFGYDVTTYDEEQRVITGYRYLAFGHRGVGRGPRLTKLKRESIDEPFALGILTTSETMQSPDLPAGEYTVAYKAAGESKAFKQARRRQELPAHAIAPEASTAAWPEVPIHAVAHDIEFPQDADVLLFSNARDAIVAYLPAGPVYEVDKLPLAVERSDDGRRWRIDFCVDVVQRQALHFSFDVELAGDGLER